MIGFIVNSDLKSRFEINFTVPNEASKAGCRLRQAETS